MLEISQKNHHLYYITSNYSNLRIYIPNFIEYFDFKSTTASVNLIEAVNTLRKMNLNKEYASFRGRLDYWEQAIQRF